LEFLNIKVAPIHVKAWFGKGFIDKSKLFSDQFGLHVRLFWVKLSIQTLPTIGESKLICGEPIVMMDRCDGNEMDQVFYWWRDIGPGQEHEEAD
jgi:hypothetical protein